MKKFLSFLSVLIMGIIYSQNSAPSSNMTAKDTGSGDIIMKTVRSSITTPATYYCTMQWNAGEEGGAYCGFQDSPDRGKLFIYSIWDPSNRQAITAPYVGSGTVVEKFGGEGTGLKAFNQNIGWNLNEWNTVVSRRWDFNNHTYFGFWVRRDSNKQWYHMVTMDYPIANVTFNSNTNAFLEDWLDTGKNTRRFEMKDGFKRKLDGKWLPMNEVVYNRHDEPRSSNYTNAVDAGIVDGAYYMQSGGYSKPSFSGNPPINLKMNTESEPKNPIIDFSITSSNTSLIYWNVPGNSTPQFKYTVKINGKIFVSNIDPEGRHANIRAKVGDKADVILEDILGRTCTKTIVIKDNNNVLTDGIYKISVENSNRYLTASGGNIGDKVYIADYSGALNQQWQIVWLGNGDYKITDMASKFSVDAFGTENGSSVGIYSYHGGSNQRWKIVNLSGNTYKVMSSKSLRSMDAYGTHNGATIGLYDYHGFGNQRFKFTLVSTNNRNASESSNILENASVKIYPNPTSSILYVELPNEQSIKQNIELCNAQGQKLESQSVSTKSEKVEFNVSKYPKGIYFIKIGDNHNKVLIK